MMTPERKAEIRARGGKAKGPPAPKAKPRLSFSELAKKRGNCAERKRQGLPCNEFAPVTHPRVNDGVPKTVLVPQPPPLNVTPTRPFAVVTVAAGDEGAALLKLSGPWMRAYAGRLNADFIVLDWPGVPGWGQSGKFAFAEVLKHYGRAVLLDADTLADPLLCPDLFSLVPSGHMGIYDDLPGLVRLRHDAGIRREYAALRASQGMRPQPLEWYGNTGIVVCDASHRDILLPPPLPVTPSHLCEQHWWVARITDSGVTVCWLPPDANYQWWEFGGLSSAPPHAIRHYSGLRPRKTAAQRLAVMRADAQPIGKR